MTAYVSVPLPAGPLQPQPWRGQPAAARRLVVPLLAQAVQKSAAPPVLEAAPAVREITGLVQEGFGEQRPPEQPRGLLDGLCRSAVLPVVKEVVGAYAGKNPFLQALSESIDHMITLPKINDLEDEIRALQRRQAAVGRLLAAVESEAESIERQLRQRAGLRGLMVRRQRGASVDLELCCSHGTDGLSCQTSPDDGLFQPSAKMQVLQLQVSLEEQQREAEEQRVLAEDRLALALEAQHLEAEARLARRDEALRSLQRQLDEARGQLKAAEGAGGEARRDEALRGLQRQLDAARGRLKAAEDRGCGLEALAAARAASRDRALAAREASRECRREQDAAEQEFLQKLQPPAELPRWCDGCDDGPFMLGDTSPCGTSAVEEASTAAPPSSAMPSSMALVALTTAAEAAAAAEKLSALMAASDGRMATEASAAAEALSALAAGGGVAACSPRWRPAAVGRDGLAAGRSSLVERYSLASLHLAFACWSQHRTARQCRDQALWRGALAVASRNDAVLRALLLGCWRRLLVVHRDALRERQRLAACLLGRFRTACLAGVALGEWRRVARRAQLEQVLALERDRREKAEALCTTAEASREQSEALQQQAEALARELAPLAEDREILALGKELQRLRRDRAAPRELLRAVDGHSAALRRRLCAELGVRRGVFGRCCGAGGRRASAQPPAAAGPGPGAPAGGGGSGGVGRAVRFPAVDEAEFFPIHAS